MPFATSKKRPWWLLILLVALIIASSVAWLGKSRLPDTNRTMLLAATLAVCGITLVNLCIRWLRWHFLLRTIHIRLRARESLLIFVSLLPMILTPWAAGELLLMLPLRHRTQHPLRDATVTWLASRGADACALILILFFIQHGLLIAAILFVVFSTLALALVERHGRLIAQAFRIYLFLGLSLTAWAIAASSLYVALTLLGSEIALPESLAAFSRGTLFGTATGLPTGIAVTGTTIIRQLIHLNISEPLAIWSVAAVRWGTVGFAALLGLITLALKYRTLQAIIAGARTASQGHFDQLAPSYAEELPAHIRDRLIKTKSAVIIKCLARFAIPPGARGLDIGCGQGWYVAHLAKQGYKLTGCDLIAGQIEQAKKYVAGENASAELIVAPAEALPFPDDTFDFAYTINVLHHITDGTAFNKALREIVRVLTPGAPLIVFEMNTLNPLFRFYLSYIFPFIHNIDDGTETWLHPRDWPAVSGARWSEQMDFITFIPDFLPKRLIFALGKLEQRLERSKLKSFSAHFAATLVKDSTN